MRRWLPALTVAAASVLAGAVLAWATPLSGGKPRGTSSATTLPSPAEDVVPPHTVPTSSLRDLLVAPSVPGFVEVPEGLAHNGPLNADQVAALSSTPETTHSHLDQDGFIAAFRRGWTVRGGGQAIVLTVYEFASRRGATDWQRRKLLGARLQGGTEFDTPGLPDAFGFRTDDTAGSVTLHDRVVEIRRDNFFEEVVWGSRAADEPVDPIIAVAAAQAAKLEGV